MKKIKIKWENMIGVILVLAYTVYLYLYYLGILDSAIVIGPRHNSLSIESQCIIQLGLAVFFFITGFKVVKYDEDAYLSGEIEKEAPKYVDEI